MSRRPVLAWRVFAVAAAFAVSVTACSTTPDAGSGTTPATGTAAAPTKVTLQLQWFTQGQFAGYLAAVDQGFYKDQGLDVEIKEGGVDIVPQTVLAQGQADYAIAWVPKALASREQGAGITDVAQVYLDGAYVGTAGRAWEDLDVDAGQHLIEVRADGYQPLQDSLLVTGGRSIRYTGTLKPEVRAPEPQAAPERSGARIPLTYYVIPGCYAGNVRPEEAGLPANCDPRRAITVTR